MSLFPANKVVPTEAFPQEFDPTLSADLQNYPLIGAGDIAILVSQNRIGIRVRVIQVDIRHVDTLSDQLYRYIQVILCDFTSFGFRFCIVQQDLGKAENREVVITSKRKMHGRHDELDKLVTRHTI